MILVAILVILLAITIGAYIWGAIGLARYAKRKSIGHAIAVVLIPPYALWFAFYQLHEPAKDRPTFLYLFGLLASALLIALFFQPLQAGVQGDWSQIAAEDIAEEEKPIVVPPVAKTPPPPPPPAPEPIEVVGTIGTGQGAATVATSVEALGEFMQAVNAGDQAAITSLRESGKVLFIPDGTSAVRIEKVGATGPSKIRIAADALEGAESDLVAWIPRSQFTATEDPDAAAAAADEGAETAPAAEGAAPADDAPAEAAAPATP